MLDPYQEVLNKFSRSLYSGLTLEEIIPVEEWLENPYFSGQFAWELWDGVKEDVAEICNDQPQLTLISGGIGTGKTKTAEAVVARKAYELLCYASPPMALGLPATATVTIALASTKLTKATDAIFRRLATNIKATEWFRDKNPPNDQIKRRLEWSNLIISPIPSTVQSAISEDLWIAVLDEANFWAGSADADSIDKVVLNMKRRMRSRFDENWMMMLVSSATTWDSYTEKIKPEADKVITRTPWQAKKERFSEYFLIDVGDKHTPPKILKKHDPGKKVIKVPIRYLKEAKEDLYGFLRDRVGIGVTEKHRLYGAWILNYEFRDNETKEEFLLPPLPVPHLQKLDELRFIHVDLALTGDWCGIGCGFVKEVEWKQTDEGVLELVPFIVVDFAIRVRSASSEEELDLGLVRDLIKWVAKKVSVAKVTFDGFQSADSIQILKKLGFDAGRLSVDRTPEPHNYLKRLFAEHRISCPYSTILVEELRALFINEKTGKIDHPKKLIDGEKGSKDVADAVAGVCWSAHETASGMVVVPEDAEIEILTF